MGWTQWNRRQTNAVKQLMNNSHFAAPSAAGKEMRGTFSAKSQMFLKEIEQAWRKEEEQLAQKHPR